MIDSSWKCQWLLRFLYSQHSYSKKKTLEAEEEGEFVVLRLFCWRRSVVALTIPHTSFLSGWLESRDALAWSRFCVILNQASPRTLGSLAIQGNHELVNRCFWNAPQRERLSSPGLLMYRSSEEPQKSFWFRLLFASLSLFLARLEVRSRKSLFLCLPQSWPPRVALYKVVE